MDYVNFIEDEKGDLVDIQYACSQLCADDLGFPHPSAWPGGMETDYDVHCENCNDLMWHGLEANHV
jgi:hypothetical protein